MIYQLDDLDIAVNQRELEQHVSYIKSLGAHVRMGGPLLDETSGQPKGRVIVIDFDTRVEAEAFVSNDPFHKIGRIKAVTIERMSIL
jgi:uncharacterized protein YciI